MRQYYLREQSANLYDCLEYWIANITWEALLVLLSGILLVTPAYWLAGLNPAADRFFYCLIQFIIMYITSSTFMTMISNITPNADLAFALGAFFMSVFFLFAGFFVILPDLPRWLHWINYFTSVPLRLGVFSLL